jgi:hypothetical protein
MFLGLLDPDPLVRGTDPDPILPFPHKGVERNEKCLQNKILTQNFIKKCNI